MTPAQNSLTSFNSVNQPTMSSREIADLVEARHDNVKRTIERCVEKGIFTFPPSEETSFTGSDGRKQTATVYQLDKRSSLIVVAQLSPEFTARVVDRWQELEQVTRQRRQIGHTTLKQMLGSATMSSVEVAQLTSVSHEIICNYIRHLCAHGSITGDGGIEHARAHPQNGLTYKEFVLSFRESMDVAAGFGRRARSVVLNHWMGIELEVDEVGDDGVQRLTYERTHLALPDARDLEQAALRTVENSFKVCCAMGMTQSEARAAAVKDAMRYHGADYTHLLESLPA